MDRIKSAFEKAMERVEQLEQPDEQQLLGWKLAPEGRRLAAAYLRGEGSLFSHLSSSPTTHRPYLIQGMAQVLTSNLQLPRNQPAQETTERALGALEKLLGDMPEAKELMRRIGYVCDQYRQFGLPQREQAYHQLKQQVQDQVSDALNSQTGTNVFGVRQGRR